MDFHGQRLSKDTHRSVTAPEARLYRKGRGREAKLCFIAHLLLENRHGLIVDGWLTEARGHAERTAALAMIEKRADPPDRITLGADKGYDAEDFVDEQRNMNVTSPGTRPGGARPSTGGPPPRLRRKPSASASGSRRASAGTNAFGFLRRIRVRGHERGDMAFAFSAAACNLMRLPKLLAKPKVA